MKKLTLLIIGIMLVSAAAFAAQKQTTPPPMPLGPETVEAKIIKVYSAEDNGVKFHAYVVNWKGQEIVLSDQMGMVNKKEGDTITFMVQRMGMPGPGGQTGVLQFMIMQTAPSAPNMGPPGMPGMGGPGMGPMQPMGTTPAPQAPSMKK